LRIVVTPLKRHSCVLGLCVRARAQMSGFKYCVIKQRNASARALSYWMNLRVSQ
jgi:hypothetical protein